MSVKAMWKEKMETEGRYKHKVGGRKVRIKVGGWLHIALDALDEAYPDSLSRGNVIPPYATTFTAKPIEKLLRYGLIGHKINGNYWITKAGRRVVRELNEVMKIEPKGEYNNWKTWAPIQGKDSEWGIPKGFKVLTVEIPGSIAWEIHFSTKTW